MPLLVRRLKVSDLPVLEALEQEMVKRRPQRVGWMDAYRRRIEKALADEPEGILVADYDGRAVGGAIVQQRGAHPISGAPYGELLGLTVAPGWKNQGIDVRLLREAEAYLRSRGCSAMTLMLPADANDDAEVFKTSGYRVSGWELERPLK
jgi:ribosomal protein S18 acetylase RimI-like enzyme